jgi:hypothetical protein
MALPALVGTLLVPILMQVLKFVTPVLRAEFEEFLKGWTARCYATPNKWDDVAARLVGAVTSIDLSGVVKPTGSADTDALVGAIVEVATGTDPFAPPGNELGGA